MNTETLDKIDTLVAEKVMGWTLCDRVANGWGKGPPVWRTNNEDNPTYQGFSPTRDPAAMMEVLEKLKDRLPELVWRCGDAEPFYQLRWWCYYRRDQTSGPGCHGAAADTMPLAVAIASLKAVGAEIPEQEVPGE